MEDRECIKLLLNKNVEIMNRVNATIEQILRRGNGTEEIKSLIESLRYVTDDIERIINR